MLSGSVPDPRSLSQRWARCPFLIDAVGSYSFAAFFVFSPCTRFTCIQTGPRPGALVQAVTWQETACMSADIWPWREGGGGDSHGLQGVRLTPQLKQLYLACLVGTGQGAVFQGAACSMYVRCVCSCRFATLQLLQCISLHACVFIPCLGKGERGGGGAQALQGGCAWAEASLVCLQVLARNPRAATTIVQEGALPALAAAAGEGLSDRARLNASKVIIMQPLFFCSLFW